MKPRVHFACSFWWISYGPSLPELGPYITLRQAVMVALRMGCG